MTTPAEFCENLGMLLRDVPRGVAARLTDFVIAWWDGKRAVFAYLREDDPTKLEEEFELDDLLWSEWIDRLTPWLNAPAFERFEEIEHWIACSPPGDAGG